MTLKTGLGVCQVIRNVTIQQSAYDFLLSFYSSYGSITWCFWDIQCRRISRPWNHDQGL